MATQHARKVADLIRVDAPAADARTALGLGNVDNTSDLAKPLSTATANALGGKSDVGHGHTLSQITDFLAGLASALATWVGSTAITTVGTITSGTWQAGKIAADYLGSGTPAAGTYLDGANGWTALPGAVGLAIGSQVDGGLPRGILHVDDSGNLANDASLLYDPANRMISLRALTGGDSLADKYDVGRVYSPANTHVRTRLVSYREGYDAAQLEESAAIDAVTDSYRGGLSFMVGGDINGTPMVEAMKIDYSGLVTMTRGLSYTSTKPLRLGDSNLSHAAGRLEIIPWDDAKIGINIQCSDYFAGGPSGIRPLIITGNDAATVLGGIDNDHRWYMGLPDQIGAMLSVQSNSVTDATITARAWTGQTAPTVVFEDTTGNPLSWTRTDGSLKPAALADTAAANDSIYYSTTAGKLVFKDPSGTVHPLY